MSNDQQSEKKRNVAFAVVKGVVLGSLLSIGIGAVTIILLKSPGNEQKIVTTPHEEKITRTDIVGIIALIAAGAVGGYDQYREVTEYNSLVERLNQEKLAATPSPSR